MISTHVQKHIPVYNLTARFSLPSKSSSRKWETIEIRAPFTRWFTSDGYFVPKPFQQWLASEIAVVGNADPDNVVEDIGRGSEAAKISNLGSVKSEDLQGVLNKLRSVGGKSNSGSAR